MLYSALFCWTLLSTAFHLAAAQTCSASSPCEIGCCNKFGNCGFGPDFCGKDCVSQCSRKSDCDPGFGSKWAKSSTCPLNVCCSKFGFCGTTTEFCGDKKVSHKTCAKNSGTNRVIGYYEGWAHERPCNVVWPEQIPIGVYTHINFAFATIDPETFQVLPNSKYDVSLYQRVLSLKKDDPGLKVFIAIGGWTFNDPGPTATTFSDISASISRQKTFIQSLISFMSTYGFDGVDLDWEYPGADDRSGRSIDFKTFPIFMARLKAALEGVGKEVSITLPASFWYLQHFDIKKLSKSVDWFNVMSYDLHGTWDKGNKWTGNFLNAHTNLTEIDQALDLIWRNDIDPSQVVMGLAFYGRAFTALSPSCSEPGCRFESGGQRGKCSKAVSVLLNSEIDNIVQQRGITPKLYQDAAVKVAAWDDQWVAYDDHDTLKMKSEYAQSRCMGGVMVWAISHDTHDAKYSMALAQLTNRKNSLLPHVRRNRDSDDPYDEVINRHAQCKWTTCDEGCPSGWIPAPRQDSGKRSHEIMRDETGCSRGVQTFCCPPGDMPKCGWYNFHNGKCKGGTCPDAMQEISSTTSHCSSKWRYQIACCTTDTDNMGIYKTYQWSTDKDCNTDGLKCPVADEDKSTEIASSRTGSGGSSCPKSSKDYPVRKLCANTANENKKFYDCNISNSGNGECAGNLFRVALDTNLDFLPYGVPAETCCRANYQDITKVLNPKVAQRREALLDWLKKPTCPNPGSLTSGISGVIGIIGRKERGSWVEVENLLVALLVRSFSKSELKLATDDWNQAMSNSFPHLSMPGFADLVKKHPSYSKNGPVQMAHNVICDPAFWNDRGGKKKTVDCSECIGPACSIKRLRDLTAMASVSSQPLPQKSSSIERRAGPRDYTAHLQSPDGTPLAVTITLPGYDSPSDIDTANPIFDEALDYDDSGDCGNSQLTTLSLFNAQSYEVEHIIEGQQMRDFLQDAAAGVLHSGAVATSGPVSISFFRTARLAPSIGSNPPPLPGGALVTRLLDRVMECLGSKTNTETFILLTPSINKAKAQLTDKDNVIAENRWPAMCQDEAHPERFLSAIRRIISAIIYINFSGTPNVNSRLATVANNIRDQLAYAQLTWNQQYPLDQVHIAEFWSEWIKDYYRMYLVPYARDLAKKMIKVMRQYWGTSTSELAPLVLQILELLRTQAEALTINVSNIN